jgi:predicted transposase YbfD/YdcC
MLGPLMESPKQARQGNETIELILKHFRPLRDPRLKRRQKHPLVNVLVMALCGVIAGADGWEPLAVFAKARADWFATFLNMPDGVPCADTFRRVFCALEPRAFEACFRCWVQALAKALHGEVVAVDGKSVRGALGKAMQGTPLHLVHVWATKQRLLLAQTAVEGAPGEVAAIPELLKLLNLEGAVVTVDANGCTAQVAQAVVQAKADYVLCLKGNRGPLHAHVKQLFAPVREGKKGHQVASYHRSHNQGHGRYEVRQAWAVRLQLNSCPKSARKWAKLKTAVMLQRERSVGGKTKVEWHYYLSSLPPKAKKLSRIIRDHWGVENGLHWCLDVCMGEDSCRIRDHDGAQNFAVITRIALTLLRREPTSKQGVPTRRKRAGWDPGYMLSVLGAGITGV